MMTPAEALLKSLHARHAALQGVNRTLADLLDWYEEEANRDGFDDDDLPPELVALEKAKEEAEENYNKVYHAT